jgi:putative serine protease PepD
VTTTPHVPGNGNADPSTPGRSGEPDQRYPDGERRSAAMSTQNPWSPWSRDAGGNPDDERGAGRTESTGDEGTNPSVGSPAPPDAAGGPQGQPGEAGQPWWGTPWAGTDQPGSSPAPPPGPGQQPSNPTRPFGTQPPAGYGQQPPGQPPVWATSPGNGSGGATPPRRNRRLAAAALVLALVSAGIGGAVGSAVSDGGDSGNGITSDAGLSHSTDSSGSAISPAAPGTVSAVAKTIMPSVVTIFEQSSSESGIGSGVIVRADGYILTNNHVVSAAGQGGTVNVTLSNGKSYPATIKGTDPTSDLAVVKINATGLRAVAVGDSNNLSIGDLVVAVGSPLGLSGTVTSGIVSALHRPVSTGDSSVQDQNAVLDAVQTDAPINPGNSGGALVNAKGELIGINSAIAAVDSGASGRSPFGGQQQQSGNIGVGFAIPSTYAASIADQLIATGTAKHPYIGVSAYTSGDVNPQTGEGSGAEVQSLVSDGPAASAGMAKDDIIVKVDDRSITSVNGLIAAVRSHNIGDTVTITYTRGGATHTARVKLTQQR